MTEPMCRHEWQTVSETERSIILFCHKCSTYRGEVKPALPPRDMYYLEET